MRNMGLIYGLLSSGWTCGNVVFDCLWVALRPGRVYIGSKASEVVVNRSWSLE